MIERRKLWAVGVAVGLALLSAAASGCSGTAPASATAAGQPVRQAKEPGEPPPPFGQPPPEEVPSKEPVGGPGALPPGVGAVGTRGQPVQAGDYRLTVVNVQDPVLAPVPTKPETRLVAVEVALENASGGTLSPGDLTFQVRDAMSLIYAAVPTSLEPSLPLASLPPGGSARGNLSFEIPTGRAPQYFVVLQTSSGNVLATIDLGAPAG